jgi:hypothetical protein
VIAATVLGEVPALPLHTAGKYVAGAYIVLFALVLIYVAIMAIRLSRIERDLGELLSMSEHTAEATSGERSDGRSAGDGAQAAGRQDPQPESTLA